MWIRTAAAAATFLCLSAVLSCRRVPAPDPEPPTLSAYWEFTEVDADTIAAYGELGGRYGWLMVQQPRGFRFTSGKDILGEGVLPAFSFVKLPAGKLPPVGIPFGINLDFSSTKDAELVGLRDLKNLTSLSLMSTKVTDEGLKELQGMQNLNNLNLEGTKVTDRGLKEFRELKELRTLELGRTGVTDAGLQELSGLKKLTSLGLQGAKVTDEGLKRLAGFETLQSLDLSNTAVSASGLMELKGLKKLSTLMLVGVPISDAGVTELQQFKNLAFLYFSGESLTETEEKRLRAALPKCSVSNMGLPSKVSK